MCYFLFFKKSSCTIFPQVFSVSTCVFIWELLYLWNYFCTQLIHRVDTSLSNGLFIFQDLAQIPSNLLSLLWLEPASPSLYGSLSAAQGKRLHFLRSAFLKYNLQTMKFTIFIETIQWVLTNTQLYTSNTITRIFPSLLKCPQTPLYSFLPPNSLALGKP